MVPNLGLTDLMHFATPKGPGRLSSLVLETGPVIMVSDWLVSSLSWTPRCRHGWTEGTPPQVSKNPSHPEDPRESSNSPVKSKTRTSYERHHDSPDDHTTSPSDPKMLEKTILDDSAEAQSILNH